MAWRTYGWRRLSVVVCGVLVSQGCSAEAPSAQTRATVSGTTAEAAKPDDSPSFLEGRWRIVDVNGIPARSYSASGTEHASVAFAPGGYGGHSGCNGYGGHGLAIGDRWFAEPPMATQQGCADLEAQESSIFSILSGGPTVIREGRDAAELRTAGGGRLRLQRTGPSGVDARPTPPPMLLAGTRWELHALDAAPVNAARERTPARLTFEADRWALQTPCGTHTGAWRQGQGAAVLEAGSTTAPACSPAQAQTAEALARTLAGELRYVVGPNGEFVLADPEHWATGRRDMGFGGEAPDLLFGRWRIASVDGGPPPPPGERAAELAFGPGFYGVWDGCAHTEGVAITRERRLFTHGSGMVTMANCPNDPVRTKINAVVAASPRIARTADGGLALVSPAGALRLERTSSQPFGVGVQTRLRSGMVFDLPSGSGRTARLTLGPGDRFSLALSCTTLKGRWRSDRSAWGPYARFGPDGAPPDCADGPDEEPLYGFFMGDVQVAIGPSRDIALFVSNGQSRPARVVTP